MHTIQINNNTGLLISLSPMQWYSMCVVCFCKTFYNFDSTDTSSMTIGFQLMLSMQSAKGTNCLFIGILD